MLIELFEGALKTPVYDLVLLDTFPRLSVQQLSLLQPNRQYYPHIGFDYNG